MPLFEGFESGTTGVFTASTTSGDEPWRAVSDTAYAGSWSVNVPNNEVIGDQRLEMINAVAIPAGATSAQMTFYHKYSFENPQVPYDGGVLEYSTDNGANWADAGALITEGGYNGIILPGANNPLALRQAWTNESPAYPNWNRVMVNLTTLIGTSVQVRFRHGSDENTGGPGWWVDNVEILVLSGCGSVTPTNTRPPTQTPGGPTATPEPTNTTGPSPTPCTLQFTDVPEGHTFYDNIRCLACRGIINGYASGCETGDPCFRPGNNVTRGQLSKIVANSAGFTEPIPGGQQSFEDVLPGSTFWEFIERLYARGIIEGYACGGAGEPCNPPENRPYFRTNNNATRGQISKIVAIARGWTEPVTSQTFEDVAPGSTFYEWIENLVSRGVMTGYACGGSGEPCVPPDNRPYFRPGSLATRGQTSKIVANTFFPECVTP